MSSYSSRDVAGFLVCLIGLLVLASGLILNPWVPRLWQGPLIVDKLDVLTNYLAWSAALGCLIIWLGRRLPTGPPAVLGMTPLILILSTMILADRLLLVQFGLPLWQYDAELHYRHRPNTVRSLRHAGRPDEVIRINAYGHHDDDFPVAKPEGEFRAVVLGDSVTMGHNVSLAETFSHQLEALLREGDTRYSQHQIINTGVHGYSTQQELRILEDALRFEPDLIAVGFCLNDVTEPFLIDERLGGVGLDYHGVTQTGNRLHGYLMNETGVGRLLQRVKNRSKKLEVEKRLESFNAENMARAEIADPQFAAGWEHVLSGLDQIYALAADHKIPVVLLIFPFDFQLFDNASRNPQDILLAHAKEHGIPAIDFIPPLAAVVNDDPELVQILRGRGFGTDRVMEVFADNLDRVLLDSDHLSGRGHEIVAQSIYKHMLETGIVGSPTHALARDE